VGHQQVGPGRDRQIQEEHSLPDEALQEVPAVLHPGRLDDNPAHQVSLGSKFQGGYNRG